jgi:hypothetical protein
MQKFLKNYDILILILLLSVLLHALSFFINSTLEAEYLISAIRIFVTFFTFRIFIIFSTRWIEYVSKGIDQLVYLNCIFVIASVSSDVIFRTSIVASTNSMFSNDTIETFRFAGFFGGYQLASYLIFLTLIKKWTSIPRFHLPWLIMASLLQSRSILLINIPLWIYLIFTKEKIVFQLLFFLSIAILLVFIYQNFNVASIYFEQRLVSLFSDNYSARDTLSVYKNIFTVDNVLLGDGVARFSPLGGGDGFYSKVFIGAGILPLLLLEFVKFFLCLEVMDEKWKGMALYALIAFFDFKGDLFFTSIALVAFLTFVFEKKISSDGRVEKTNE